VRRVLVGAAAVLLVRPSTALAHGGLVGRSDLPVPGWLFGWAATAVLVVSFVGLAVLWQRPVLERDTWHPIPGGRVLGSTAVEAACGVIGVAFFVLTIVSGLAGTQEIAGSFAATLILVIFWVGFVVASALFGDVFRAFNPWRAIGRAFGGTANRVAGSQLPPPLEYPERLGRWPAAAGLVAFTLLELVSSASDDPRNIAIAALVYSGFTFLGMMLFGVEQWTSRGEAFSVYFNLFSRISAFARRDGVVGVQRPLTGLATMKPMPGTIAVLVVMIGSVSFDGAGEGAFQEVVPDLLRFFDGLGFSAARTSELTFLVGYLFAIVVVGLFYRLGIAGVRGAVPDAPSARTLAEAFAPSLIPIAFAYVVAHYISLLLYQGQMFLPLLSDPLGDGSDLLGLTGGTIDYSILSATAFWYIQVGVVVFGHVAALALAHDRALTLFSSPKWATRSQYWMLVVMIGFTVLALWLLNQQNAG
jgi:hypothetical protein